MGIGYKIKSLLEKQNRNVNEFSSAIDISPPTLYSIIQRDNTKVDLDILQKIANGLSVPLDFFCTNPTETISLSENNSVLTLTSKERQLVLDFRELPSQEQENILEMVALAKNNTNEVAKIKADIIAEVEQMNEAKLKATKKFVDLLTEFAKDLTF